MITSAKARYVVQNTEIHATNPTFLWSTMSYVYAYLNRLPAAYAAFPLEKKAELKGKARETLTSVFNSNLDGMVERMFRTGNFGPLPMTIRFVEYMPALFDLFTVGHYYAAIAMAGVTAERLCIDLFLISDVMVNEEKLTDEQKEGIVEMNQYARIQFLSRWSLIRESTRTKLHEIRKCRNKYMHPSQAPSGTQEADAEHLIRVLCEVAETEFGPSEMGRYTIEDGGIKFRSRQAK